jgi:hypothetical protein
MKGLRGVTVRFRCRYMHDSAAPRDYNDLSRFSTLGGLTQIKN